jgi:16S rRNA (guanine527-N7)-methyltransferase
VSDSERDVSRETEPLSHGSAADEQSKTPPPPPPEAADVFGDRLDLAAAYVDLLASEATVRGLIGPREVPRLWERHLLNCAPVTELIDPEATVCDVGSGAGLPGIVLAIRRPDIQVKLLEPLLRRSTFLEFAVHKMALSNVSVHRGRAEDVSGDKGFEMGFDVVTSRAVAPLERLVGWSLPLARPGGLVLAMKGASAAEELDRARTVIGRCGGTDPRVHVLGEQWVEPPTTVVAIRRRR